MSMICPQCSEMIPAGSDFCGECGAKKPAAKQAAAKPKPTTQTQSAAPTTKVDCNNCGARVPSAAKFCPECGADPRAVKKADVHASGNSCPHCQAKIPPGAKFCPECGKAPGKITGKQPTVVAATGHTCKACGKGFEQGVYVTAMGGKWHAACFACGECKTPIKAQSFAVKNGMPWCNNCVEKFKKKTESQGGHLNTTSESTLKCTACGKGIMSKYIKPDGKPYHSECFVCENGCGANLVKGYVEKGGKKICAKCADPRKSAASSAPKVAAGSLTCTKCFDQVPPTADRCPSCKKPLTVKQLEKLGRGPKAASSAPAPAASSGGGNKFCGECGAKQDGGAFCGECGAKQ